MTASKDSLFDPWFEPEQSDSNRVIVLKERDGGRDEVFRELVDVVADHLVDLSVIENMGGLEASAHVLRHRLPQRKKDRSGDLGEILATEYVDRQTGFHVPVRRLRYKDDRASAMRGDDVLGFGEAKRRVKVIKVEAKSRASLSAGVIEEARTGLAKYKGRPNPSTLAFLEYVLRKENRDNEAECIRRLQCETIRARDVRHMVFTLSGNDPSQYLAGATELVRKGIDLLLCGCRVSQHGDFVRDVFDKCLSLGEGDGVS